MDWIAYLILVVYVAITFWVVVMWIDKMWKIIIANYIAGITCFAFGNCIHQCVMWLMSQPHSTFIWISFWKYASFLSAGQLTFILLLFALIVWLIHCCWRIQISFNTTITTEKLYFVILIPITVMSFVIGPYIALHADWIETLNTIENLMIRNFSFLYPFIQHISLWIFINWIAFIILSSRINFKISLSAKATKLPEWI